MKAQTRTILLVEDEPNDQLLFERALRLNGTKDTLRMVGHGAEAIAYLNGEGEFADRDKFPFPSCIVTDLKMPIMDGLTVLEHLKGNPQWCIIPVIVLSASGDADDIKKAYKGGASSYFCKPPDLFGLKELLRKFNEYWNECEVPEVDLSGVMLETISTGKIGERF